MRKSLSVLFLILFAVGTLFAPAQAKKRPKPVLTTLYLHDDTPIGDGVQRAQYVAGEGYMPMDATEPSGSVPKSHFITNYAAGPNDQCAGNSLFPVWQGKVSGAITGTMTFSFTTVSTPASIVVRVWPDVTESQCDDSYPTPVAETRLELAGGEESHEVVFKGVDFQAMGSLVVQISPVLPLDGGNPFAGRVLYDATGYESALQFSCSPTTGKSCVVE